MIEAREQASAAGSGLLFTIRPMPLNLQANFSRLLIKIGAGRERVHCCAYDEARLASDLHAADHPPRLEAVRVEFQL
jgi:hypothetical protein